MPSQAFCENIAHTPKPKRAIFKTRSLPRCCSLRGLQPNGTIKALRIRHSFRAIYNGPSYASYHPEFGKEYDPNAFQMTISVFCCSVALVLPHPSQIPSQSMSTSMTMVEHLALLQIRWPALPPP